MKTRSAWLLAAAFLAAHALAASPPAPTAAATPTVPSSPDSKAPTQFLTFFDSELFDGHLYDELSKKPDRVEIDMPGHVELTSISPRLDRWLTVIGQNGAVTLQETPEPEHLQSKFVFSFVPMLFSMAEQWHSSMMDAQAKHYEATVFYHKDANGNALIDRVVMTRKQ